MGAGFATNFENDVNDGAGGGSRPLVRLGGSPMAKKSQDTKPQEGAASESATAVDYVRTKQELDAAESKRQAEADLAAAHQPAGADFSSPAKSHPKVHRSEEEGPIEDTSGEPVVEDEP